jgi:hypothetical protein
MELYDILRTDLNDVDIFIEAVRSVLVEPKKFGLSIE